MTRIEELLNNALHEISSLRRTNEILAAKVSVMELFATTLRTQPYYEPIGSSSDVAWAIRKELEELKNKNEAAK